MAILTVATLFIRESRPSLLLAKKVATLRGRTGQDLKFDNHDAVADHERLIDVILIRPATLLVSEPLVILVTTLFAVSWAIIYLFTEALTDIYKSMGFSQASASLPFLAIGVGVLFSIFPRFFDVRIARKRKERGEPLEPEDKLTGFVLAVVSLAIGLWWFAWSIPPAITTVPWIVPTLGLVFIGFAVNEMAYTLSSYLADSYTVYAASAFAALAFVRAVVSGLMPLIAYAMYGRMSANLATTIIAVLSTLFGVAPYIMLRYSKILRGSSKFAKYSLEVHERTRIEVD
jgi:MFS family permease